MAFSIIARHLRIYFYYTRKMKSNYELVHFPLPAGSSQKPSGWDELNWLWDIILLSFWAEIPLRLQIPPIHLHGR